MIYITGRLNCRGDSILNIRGGWSNPYRGLDRQYISHESIRSVGRLGSGLGDRFRDIKRYCLGTSRDLIKDTIDDLDIQRVIEYIRNGGCIDDGS